MLRIVKLIISKNKPNVYIYMMSNELQIYLHNYEDFYLPGQIIKGRVECNFSSDQTIRGVLVQFTGKCTTSWTESETYYDDFFKEDRTRQIDYNGEEVYFDYEISLTGPSALTLSEGKHVYNFSYQLPETLPSSYTGPNDWGSVQYKIKALIDRQWRFNTEVVTVLNINSPVNLNYVPRIREPIQISLEEVLCFCWCNNGGTLTFSFSLPSSGFIPGQGVNVGACIQNLTSSNVQEVKFKISELTELVAKSPTTSFKHNKDVVVASTSGSIGAHGEKSWTTVLTIPQDRYIPNLVHCSLIKVTYNLKGEAVLPCPHSNLKASVPITIGHVQFEGADVNVELGPPPEQIGDISNVISPTAPPDDYDQLPPSYDEAQMIPKMLPN